MLKMLFINFLCTFPIAISCAASPSGTGICNLSPQDTVLVLDFHGVLLDFDSTKIPVLTGLSMLPNFLHYFFRGKDKCIESFIDPTDQSSLAVINPHKPNLQAIELIKALKAQGFQIFGCSNVGERSLEYLRKLYLELFENFKAIRSCGAHNGYIKKNNPRAFQELLRMIDQNCKSRPKRIILIDDSKSNLKLAKRCDPRFKTILFKNCRQLKAELKKMGLATNLS